MTYRFLGLAVNHAALKPASAYRGGMVCIGRLDASNLCLKNRSLDEKCNRFKNGVETVRRLEPVALKGYTPAH
ncbi:hypothetical protein [Rhizobium sp. RU33A]|uniref:hypothetical protein n=1 Tax=Rhizobium sp. RU33A TaxID=1907413 RepID=UPI0011157AB2|nr:hypothetical protein [Rhizobium sp. RU33A]